MRTVFAAFDWSGAKARGGARDIALAEAADERLVDIRVGLSRTDVERWLLRGAASTREMVVGLDFAFSLPAWFAREKLHATSVADVWAIVEAEGEQWLDGSAPWPFWGRGERPGSARLPADRALRHTEREVAVLTGAQPKSAFQLVGAGQVGPGSIRGMPMLRRLRAQGFAVWPFDAFSMPLLVEIYPRVFTGNVVKSNPVARQHYLSLLGDLGPRVAAAAAASEHAFDAACSALAMARQVEIIEQLAPEPTPYDIEGKMFVAAPLPAPRPDTAQARPGPPVITPVRTHIPSLSHNTVSAHADMPGAKRPMVRVIRTSVTDLDDVPTDELHERIEKLQRLVADRAQLHLRLTAERTLRACRRALEPDFAHSKVHHESDCWFVDRYEEGRFAGGAKRKFVLVPADAVPDGVGGCQYCASGRPPAVKLKQQEGAGGATSSPAARRPLSQAGHENRVSRVSGLNYANAEAFIASIPDGCFASFKDVATAAGNPDAAMPIGNWLRDSGGFVDKDWRVLRSDGYIPDGFVGHAPGLPHDAQSARDLLRAEGVRFSHAGKASETQRFRYEHWTGRAATSWSPDCDPPPAPTGIQIGMTVRIRDLDSGEQRTWTLVAKPDASPSDGRLSIESPIGVVLRGKEIGDTATATTPKGPRRCAIEHHDPKG